MTRSLSVQLYTVRDQLAQNRPATIERLAEIGFSAVEPFAPTDDPAGLRALLDEVGMSVSATHCRLHKQDPGPIFAAAKTLGTDRVIVPGGIDHNEFITRAGLERTAELLNGLAMLAADEGLRLGYHNHWWEIEPLVGARHALEVLAELLAPEVFLEVDTYWAAVGGADVPGLLGRLGERVQALHVKDGPIVKGEPQTAVGAGKMPVADIITAAPQAQLVVELDTCATGMMTAMADSYTYLTTVLAEEQA